MSASLKATRLTPPFGIGAEAPELDDPALQPFGTGARQALVRNRAGEHRRLGERKDRRPPEGGTERGFRHCKVSLGAGLPCMRVRRPFTFARQLQRRAI